MLNMRKRYAYILTILLSFFGLTTMSTPIAAVEQANNTKTIIIDVRSVKEFAEGSNPNSVNIPLDELETKLSTIDKDQNIIVCCASGRRSAMAATILKNHGYTHVVNAGSWRNT